MKNLTLYETFLLEKKWEKTVKSSHLTEISYDSDTQILTVEFHDGSIYDYADVPNKVYQHLSNGPTNTKESHGTRFWDLIRKGNYKHTKVK